MCGRVAVLVGILTLTVPQIAVAIPVEISVSGPFAFVSGQVAGFRTLLGDPDNLNAPGPLPAGRREINWDGGGSATTVSPTPFAGFQNIRGALFTTPGTGLVQAPPSGLVTTFNNPTYATTFQAFSPLRLFSAIGSNVTDVEFFIPGTNGTVPATVAGFGVVFNDVDLVGSTTLQFFDASGNPILAAPLGALPANDGFSLVGAIFDSAIIDRVRITSGNVAPGPNDDPLSGVDIVMMDNFLYTEPVPEPATLVLAGSGVLVAGLYAWRRRRRR